MSPAEARLESTSANERMPAVETPPASPTAHWTAGRALALFLALAHLVWVACGAAHWGPSRPLWLTKALSVYSPLTGTGNSFGYFSPEILSELRGRFEITDRHGQRTYDQLEAGYTREAGLRIAILTSSIGEHIEDKKVRQQLAAHWAKAIFARHPEARRVGVVMEEYQLPSLREFPQDSHTGWNLFYKIAFERAR